MIARQLLPMRVFDVFLSLSAGRGRALEAGFCSLFSRTALCSCRWSTEPLLLLRTGENMVRGGGTVP